VDHAVTGDAVHRGRLRQTRVLDGTRLAYRLVGQKQGPVYVLCDGISCDGFAWRYLEPALVAAGAQLLHIHYRGHGRSGLPPDHTRVTLPDLASDIDHLMGRLRLGPATLIGHSMGVQVTLETAWRHPDRVRAMVLMCGSYGRVLDGFKGSDIGARLLPLVVKLARQYRGAVSRTLRAVLPTSLTYWLAALGEIKGDKIRQQDFMPYLEHFSRMPLDAFVTMLTDAHERTSLAFLPRLRQPALVLAGADDTFTPPSSSELLADRLPNADLVVIENASHTGPLEHPGRFNDAIMAFSTKHDLLTPNTAGPAMPPTLSERWRHARK
jgi:pimeloyl-ACP methyl ester carboxylesterase